MTLQAKPFTPRWRLLAAVGFVVLFGALILLGFSTRQVMTEAELAVGRVRHTLDMLSEVATIRESTLSIETLVRGYVISGERAVLAQKAGLEKRREAALARLRTLTQDNVSQQTRIEGLLGLIQARRDLAARIIETRETQGFEAARLLSMSGRGTATRERYLNQISQIQDEEQRLLKQRDEEHKVASAKTVQMNTLVLAAMGGLLLAVFVIVGWQIKSRADQHALELENHALVVEKKAAEQTAQAKDEFLATMSHEIRTPMSSLLGLMELLARSPLSRDQTEMLNIARDSGRSMVRIIDDILDHAKIEAGKLKITLEPVSIGHLLSRVCNNYATLASSKGLDLRYLSDPRISAGLMADPHRLMQVLGNLVSNAIKFTPGGFVELRADFIRREAGVETVRISVKDTGLGMSPELQARLFQPFEQAGADTAHLYGGTGLGLAISRKLTQMMGGELQVQSATQEGTTFSVTLDLALSDTVPVGQMRSPARSSFTSVAQMAKSPLIQASQEGPVSEAALDEMSHAPWVLAVDDNQTNRILIQRQLSLLGLRVRTAIDGDQAFELWQNGDYALVLTDINMTALNGYELARSIRSLEAAQGRSRTPVLGWTANAMADTHARCLAAGMDDVLHKPADLARLRELLAHWLPGIAAVDTVTASAIGPSDGATEGEALDVKLLQESFGNDRDKLRQLMPNIQKTLNEQFAAMHAALDAADLAGLKAMGHQLCGSAGLMGAKALADVCRRIEALADQGDLSVLPELAQEFSRQAQRTRDGLLRLG